jgi:hypothetical protein
MADQLVVAFDLPLDVPMSATLAHWSPDRIFLLRQQLRLPYASDMLVSRKGVEVVRECAGRFGPVLNGGVIQSEGLEALGAQPIGPKAGWDQEWIAFGAGLMLLSHSSGGSLALGWNLVEAAIEEKVGWVNTHVTLTLRVKGEQLNLSIMANKQGMADLVALCALSRAATT